MFSDKLLKIIDYSLYPKHEWKTIENYGFFELYCETCGYGIMERYADVPYIMERIHGNWSYTSIIRENIEEHRKTLLSCEEAIIKKLLE